MIQTYSPTIRRKEMEAVLTCMVDEKIGPGEMNVRLLQTAKELIGYDGGVALRSPSLAVRYVMEALQLPKESMVMISALAPSYLYITLENLGYKPLVLDVAEDTGLVTVEACEKGMKEGGRLLILSETMGVLPDIESFLSLGIPIVEDISHSALSYYPSEEKEEEVKQPAVNADGTEAAPEKKLGRRAGMYGVYTIMAMEDRDVITSGGGALLFAPSRREWIVLKKIVDEAPSIDILPDMNAALAFVELKEFNRNEITRRELFTVYSRAIMSGRHRSYVRASDEGSTVYSFPLVLNSGFKDVKSYAQKKGIEVRQAYEDSVIAMKTEELSQSCICAKSLLLRCALFPLYPRLGKKDVSVIAKVLSSLP